MYQGNLTDQIEYIVLFDFREPTLGGVIVWNSQFRNNLNVLSLSLYVSKLSIFFKIQIIFFSRLKMSSKRLFEQI